MKEGDVVIVVGKLDDHIRDKEDRVGTVVYLNKEEAVVLLSNGDLWKGHKRDVVLQSEQLSY